MDACLNLENKINDNIKPVPSYTLNIMEDTTIVLEVFEGAFKPYLYKGKAYKRNDTSTIEVERLELNRLILEGLHQSYEEQDSKTQNLIFQTLEAELMDTLHIERMNTDVLRTLGLIKNDKYNNAAALLADHNTYKGIDCIRFGKTINEIMDREILDHISIISMFHKAVDIYQTYYQYEKIEGALRIKKEKVPKNAFRESIANAIIHRLWDVNAHIKIAMYEDRIEITSPGGLPSEISEEEDLTGQISFLRNPIIGNVFFRLNYIEMFGSGIQRINAEYANKFVKPQYKVYENSISIILPVVIDNLILSEDEERIVQLLESNLKLSRIQIEEKCHFSKHKTIRILNALIEKNIVKKSGATRDVTYALQG